MVAWLRVSCVALANNSPIKRPGTSRRRRQYTLSHGGCVGAGVDDEAHQVVVDLERRQRGDPRCAMSPLPPVLLLLPLFHAVLASYATDSLQAPISLDPPALTSLWDPPSPNATDHLIFSSVSSLLHTWHNARYRNGHTIVPGTIPKGTLLHHGTSKKEVPTTPEWTAFDPEFSFMFCHAARGAKVAPSYNRMDADGSPGGCWHLTLRTTRPLNILYFDGSAAVKIYGPLDA